MKIMKQLVLFSLCFLSMSGVVAMEESPDGPTVSSSPAGGSSKQFTDCWRAFRSGDASSINRIIVSANEGFVEAIAFLAFVERYAKKTMAGKIDGCDFFVGYYESDPRIKTAPEDCEDGYWKTLLFEKGGVFADLYRMNDGDRVSYINSLSWPEDIEKYADSDDEVHPLVALERAAESDNAIAAYFLLAFLKKYKKSKPCDDEFLSSSPNQAALINTAKRVKSLLSPKAAALFDDDSDDEGEAKGDEEDEVSRAESPASKMKGDVYSEFKAWINAMVTAYPDYSYS